MIIPKKLKKNEDGQAMAELALVLPIFFLVVAFVIAASQLILGKMAVNSATQTGCREAILYSDITVAKEKADDKAKDAMANGLNLEFLSSTIELKTENDREYYVYTVTFDSKSLFTWDSLGGDGTLLSTSIMMTEY